MGSVNAAAVGVNNDNRNKGNEKGKEMNRPPCGPTPNCPAVVAPMVNVGVS